jgi:hypothetical protein
MNEPLLRNVRVQYVACEQLPDHWILFDLYASLSLPIKCPVCGRVASRPQVRIGRVSAQEKDDGRTLKEPQQEIQKKQGE